MDPVLGQIIVAALGGGGATGAVQHFLSLNKLRKRMGDMEARLKKLENQSPEALMKRLEEVEEIRQQDRREAANTLSRHRELILKMLDEIGRLQTRLNMPAV
jgi:hypothetical protein